MWCRKCEKEVLWSECWKHLATEEITHLEYSDGKLILCGGRVVVEEESKQTEEPS